MGKALQLPAHHQTDWDAFQVFLRQSALQEKYSIAHPHLIVDTAQSLHDCLMAVSTWLEHLTPPSHEGVRIDAE